MTPQAPAATPTTSNTNQAFGGFGQVNNDYSAASGILANLPTQEAQSTDNATSINNNPGSILPNVTVNAPTYTAPTAATINPASYGTNETAYNAAVQNAEQSQTAAENSTYGAAQGALSSAEQQYGNLTPVYQSLASEYNIPGYQNDVATLSGLLQNLNQDVNTQTTLGGGAITGAARDEMYSNESNPLNLALSNASEFLNYGQNDVSNLLDTYEKSLGNALTPLETNISSLPTMFGQANEAAESGYGQGATAIQNTISNEAEQQSLGLQAQYNDIQAAAEKAEYGTGEGNVASDFASASNGTLPGMTFKNSAAGAQGGYAFTVNGTAASAASYAAANAGSLYGAGTSPVQAVGTTIENMASAGDPTANAAYQEIVKNNGQISSAIISKYPSLFWGWQ